MLGWNRGLSNVSYSYHVIYNIQCPSLGVPPSVYTISFEYILR